MRKVLISIALVLTLVLSFAVPVFAAPSADVTVTAAPSYISITIAQNTWTVNGLDDDGKIDPDTTYYSNETGATGDTTAPTATVVDGDCYFEVVNASTVITDLTTNMIHFTGGDAMQNIETGYANNGASAYGASTYVTGAAWPGAAVIVKNSGSDAMTSSLAATTNIKFGIAIKTQSDAWSTGSAMTSTVTVTATES